MADRHTELLRILAPYLTATGRARRRLERHIRRCVVFSAGPSRDGAFTLFALRRGREPIALADGLPAVSARRLVDTLNAQCLAHGA